MKTFFKNLTFTFLCLGISTILAFFFFNLGQKNSVNTALIYILALILIAQNTTSYWYGAAASVFCVIAANYFFTYPYFKLNFILDGYPVTFIGMLIPGLRSRPMIVCAVVAGATAVLLSGLPNRLGLMAATLAGVTAGMLAERAGQLSSGRDSARRQGVAK